MNKFWYRLYAITSAYMIILSRVYCKVVQGQLKTPSDWHFLTRFCFLSEVGKLEFEVQYPQENYEPQNILLYFDEPDQWPAVYKSNKNCTVKTSPPHIYPENGQVIELKTGSGFPDCQNKADVVHCKDTVRFQSVRNRWWFVTTSRCIPLGDVTGLNLKYRILLTNGEEADFFFYHFSADEFYILQVDIAFLCANVFLLILTVICAVQLQKKQVFHTTYKLFMACVICEVIHLFFMCVAYGKYANDGLDNSGLKTTGRVWESFGQLIFILMLILMAKGFTITRGKLRTSSSIKIAIFITIYSICNMVLFVYQAYVFDPGEVLYLYESPAGYGLVGLRLLGWVWFCYATFFTLKHYPEKATFYYPFFIFFTI